MMTYVSNIQTPMGAIKGKLAMEQKGNTLSGYIEAMGMKSEFSNGRIEKNECQFSGNIQTMLGNISYEAEGKIQGEHITITAKTNMGDFTFEGIEEN